MITINLSPIRSDDLSLVITKSGEVLTINGTQYNLGDISEGSTLPNPEDPFAGDITRTGGNVELTLLFPLGADASQEQRFPVPIIDPVDGEVTLP